ncbi:MAG: helix-turn-helix domain-containing protein [Kiritimatiellae bacterium]|nr:helix-turn-helix domain-containing protein [Kiritimatiellia bacterium]
MVGEILKQAREAKCLTQRDIAQNTNLLLQVVVDLEHDDFRRIPAAIYGRGFIKLYAEYVGLPPDQVDKLLQTFKQQYDGAHAPPVRTKPVPQQQPNVIRRPSVVTQNPAEAHVPQTTSVPAPTPVIPQRLEPPQPQKPSSQPSPAPVASAVSAPVETPPVPNDLEQTTTPVPVTAVSSTPEPPPRKPISSESAAVPAVSSPVEPQPEEPSPTASAEAASERQIPEKIKPQKKPDMDDDGLLPLFAALHTTRNDEIPENVEKTAEIPVEEPVTIPVKPAVSIAPVQVKEDFLGPVVPPENQVMAEDGDDLFSMAKRLTQLRNGNSATPDSTVPEEPAEPVVARPKPVVSLQPAKIVLPGKHEEGPEIPAGSEEPQAPKPAAKPPFVLTMKRAVRISLDRITQAAHRSLDASSRAIQPARSFFAGRGKMVFLCGAGAAVLLILLFGIHYLFQVTEQRIVEQETATSLPPPELYLD